MAYALCGVKPIVETWRVLSGAPLPAGYKFPHEVLLSLSRVAEVLFESLPQAALQSYILLRTAEPTALQYVSLIGSCCATGYIFAMTDFDMARVKS